MPPTVCLALRLVHFGCGGQVPAMDYDAMEPTEILQKATRCAGEASEEMAVLLQARGVGQVNKVSLVGDDRHIHCTYHQQSTPVTIQ